MTLDNTDITLWRCYSVKTLAERWKTSVKRVQIDLHNSPSLELGTTGIVRYPWWAVAGVSRPLPHVEVVRARYGALPPCMGLTAFLLVSWDEERVGAFLDLSPGQVRECWADGSIPSLQWGADPLGSLGEWIIKMIWEDAV